MKCFSTRMTFDLFDKLLNSEMLCFFHNWFWQSWHSEVNVELLHLGGLLSTYGSPRSCLIFVFNFYKHWHATLDGFWSIHGSHLSCWALRALVTRQDIFLDLLGGLLSTHGSHRSWYLFFGFGWIRWVSLLLPATSESNSFIQLSLKGNRWWWSKVIQRLSRIWFLQIPSQQLSRYNKLGVYRGGWLHYILFDTTSILYVQHAVYRPHTRYLGALSTFACKMEDVIWSAQALWNVRCARQTWAWATHVRVIRCESTRKCDVWGVLFTPIVGCSRLLSTVNDLTTTKKIFRGAWLWWILWAPPVIVPLPPWCAGWRRRRMPFLILPEKNRCKSLFSRLTVKTVHLC